MKLIGKYIDYLRYEKNNSSCTEISYSTDLRQFEEYLQNEHQEVEMLTVDSDVIRLWMVSLMKSNISARSVNRKLSALKSFYRYLQKIGEIKHNPASRVVAPKMKKPIPVFVKDKDMELLLEEPSDEKGFIEYRNFLILELFYVTGIRRAELIGMQDVDADLSSKAIQVTGKGNKQRLIPISDDVVRKIRKYIDLRSKEVEVMPEAFFVREDGKALYPMLVHRVITEKLKMISVLSKTSPHVLRHSFATAMLNNGADINAVKEILGHASLAATEVYTHTSFEELKNIYNQAHPRA